jgi:hypothetical protein
MQTITHDQFVSLLRAKLGAVILGLETITTPKAHKGAPEGLGKVSKGRAVTGANYGRAVEKQSGKAFTVSPLPYGEWLVPNKVILHKGELQLRTESRNQKPMKSYFTSQGNPIPYVPDKASSSNKQEKVGLFGNRQVTVRNFKFDSIKTIKYAGETYRLVK